MSEIIEDLKTLQTPSLMENEHVQELLAIMKENNMNNSDLLAVFDCVASLETQLNSAVSEISAMRKELSEMRDVQNNPEYTALHNAVRSAESRVGSALEWLSALKNRIVADCKGAVETFKEKGTIALDNLASFFHINDGLQAMKDNFEKNIRQCESSIDIIERISDTYHEAGRRIKNAGRALAGQDALEDAKPTGKLAKALQAPARREKQIHEGALKYVNKAIAGMERLELSAEKTQARHAEKKPSVVDSIREHKEKAAQEKRDTPAVEKPKAQEASL